MMLVAAEEMTDCLLHAEHHHMTGECWDLVIEFYVGTMLDGFSQAEARDRYKAAYEGAVLEALMREVR